MPVIHQSGDHIVFRCPGCRSAHRIPANTDGVTGWQWNGDVERPTISPSILTRSNLYGPDKLTFEEYEGPVPCDTTQSVCHSFVREGMIEFLSDCTHELAGQTVRMAEWRGSRFETE